MVTARTTTKLVTEVIMEGNDTYNPGQIREMADEVINYIDLPDNVIISVFLVGS